MRHPELAKDPARSGTLPAQLHVRRTPDLSGLKSLKMTPMSCAAAFV